jgi:hypothetical protein
MRARGLGLLALVIALGIVALQPRPTLVSAEALLQETPRLEGVNIYFTEAGGEASRFDRSDAGLSRFAGLLRQLGASLYTLEWRTGFPSDADLIVVVGPQTDFAPDQIARLWAYVNNGGKLLLLANPVVESRSSALPATSGLFQLMWADFGLRAVADYLIIDNGVPPEAPAPAEGETPAPVAPRIVNRFISTNLNAQHPITSGLQGELAFFGARSLEVDSAIQGFIVTPLAFADAAFYGESDFARFTRDGTLEFNIGTDTTAGNLAVAGAFDDPRSGARIVLVGDADFARNGTGLQTAPRYSAGFVYPGNVRFLLNAVTWLVNAESVTLEFPTPGATETPTITPTQTPTRTPTGTPTSAAPESTDEAATPTPTPGA